MIRRAQVLTIAAAIDDDCIAMERANPNGTMHSWVSRFAGYAAALRGHVPTRLPEVGAAPVESAPTEPANNLSA